MSVDRITAQLARAGLDIVHAFDAHAIARRARESFRKSIAEESLAGWERLAHGPRVGLLVGNTRTLWPHFVAARRAERDPLDHYIERAIDPLGVATLYAHRAYESGYLPFQHLAVAVGLGTLTEGRLVVHPIYGQWFALRAVLAVDGTPPERAPIAKPCVCTDACPRALAAARANVGDGHAWIAVRDACTLREWRYSDEQIRFHYASAWPDLRDDDSGQ